MKRSQFFLILCMCAAFLSACGGKVSDNSKAWEVSVPSQSVAEESSQAEAPSQEQVPSSETPKERYDIFSEKEFLVTPSEERSTLVGMQFYAGEAIQLFSQDAGIVKYLPGGESELVVDSALLDSGVVGCFLDMEGSVYIWNSRELKKLNADREKIYTTSLSNLEMNISNICQLTDGRIYLVVSDKASSTSNPTRLAELDVETGLISKLEKVPQTFLKTIAAGGIGAGENGLLMLDTEGIWEINVEEGSRNNILSFVGTSYTLQYDSVLHGFAMVNEGLVQLLRQPFGENVGYEETLMKSAPDKSKTEIVLRGMEFNNNTNGMWLKEQVAQFNKSNKRYYVVLEEREEGTDAEDFARTTSVEIATGKGPDILCGEMLDDYVIGMLEKGAFADMSPYMKASGLKEEDYFPVAFNCWRDGEKIYGVNTFLDLRSYQIDARVVANVESLTVESLADALLAWKEKNLFMFNYTPEVVLRMLLEGSETLWGMVDWENATCDFGGALFDKLLKVAKQYGYDGRNKYEWLVQTRTVDDFWLYDSQAKQAAEGKRTSGVLFDEGCYAEAKTDWILAVNANSAHKEGAWEFIQYLLSEEAQSAFPLEDRLLPVKRVAFEAMSKKELKKGVRFTKNGVELERVTDEELAEMIQEIETARPLPIRTVPILDIICEEASDYFEGIKSAEEVIAVIENRVRLYLEEQR